METDPAQPIVDLAASVASASWETVAAIAPYYAALLSAVLGVYVLFRLRRWLRPR